MLAARRTYLPNSPLSKTESTNHKLRAAKKAIFEASQGTNRKDTFLWLDLF